MSLRQRKEMQEVLRRVIIKWLLWRETTGQPRGETSWSLTAKYPNHAKVIFQFAYFAWFAVEGNLAGNWILSPVAGLKLPVDGCNLPVKRSRLSVAGLHLSVEK